MTDLDLDRVVAGIAPVPGAGAPEPGLTPGALELLDEITATPRPAARRHTAAAPVRGRRPAWAGALLVAGLTCAVVMLTWLLPRTTGVGPRPAAALDIRQDGGYYVITVKNLFADPGRYQRELHQRGLAITLRVVPASPSLQGEILLMDMSANGLTNAERARRKDLISTIDRPARTCSDMPPNGCPIGLRVPVGYRYKAEILLGREARPGENYTTRSSLGAPREPLHCVRFMNKTVDEVLPLLRAHGVPNAIFASYGARRSVTSVPGGWFVHDAVLSAPGQAIVLANPYRSTSPDPIKEFCPQGH